MSYLSTHIRAATKTVITMPTPTVVDGKPVDWAPTSVVTEAAGFFVVYMYPQGGVPVDVTYFRGVPTQLRNYSFVDPFTYGAAVIEFPQITEFDDLDALGFLGTEDNPANVDIFWYAAAAGADFRHPVTNQVSLTYGTPTKLWEGFIASKDIRSGEGKSSLVVQCQGALFEADHTKQKPWYPRRPYVMERLIYEVLYPFYDTAHPFGKPSLRTLPVFTRWPAGWSKITQPRQPDEPNIYTPVIPPNRLWTGLITRNTGSWENTLTGYIQDILAVLYTTDDSGVTAGNQWTLRCEENRQPVLEVRDRNRPPDFEVWVGTPGVEIDVTEDHTTKENALYGEGTGVDGTTWRNSFITGAWFRTDYEPLAAKPEVFPPQPDNPSWDENIMLRESKTQYGSGMELEDAEITATKRLEVVQNAGLAGTMTLRADPSAFPKWHVKAGMTVKVKGLKGKGATGINFHIAEAVHNLESGAVELKVDTKYRDLLTLEEVRARNIDPLTPSKLLQVGKRSVMIEDILAPWDYHQGSGYIPRTARYGKNRKEGFDDRYNYFAGMSRTTQFPWDGSRGGEDWVGAHPPSSSIYTVSEDGMSKGPFVRVDANASDSKNRWSIVPVLTAQKAQIRLIEVAAYDSAGRVLEIPFHVSFFHAKPTRARMPQTDGNYSPFVPGHFESISPTGVPTPNQAPPETHIIGWGNAEQPAGYWPGLFSKGAPASGLFRDEGQWNIDNSTPENISWDEIAASEGETQPQEAITIYAAIYAEHTSNVFFLGRIYKMEQA